MKKTIKAENWVDDTVTYEKVSETQFKYNGEVYFMVEANDEANDGGKFDFFNFKVYTTSNSNMLFDVSKFRKDSEWTTTDGEIERMAEDPMDAAVKLLAMIGA